jgi:cardiolipin synthase
MRHDAVDAMLQPGLDRAAGVRAVEGNRVTLKVDGTEAFPAMFEVIESARSRIQFENYIIRDDATGRRFAEALAARARAGVEVRVVADWLGSAGTGRAYWRELRKAGAEVRLFNPPELLRIFRNVERNHRKLVVGDGRLAVVGGLCIGDEWTGNPAAGIQPWRDSAVLVEGPAASLLERSFGQIWTRAGGLPLVLPSLETIPAAGEARIRVLSGAPGRGRTARVLEFLATTCRERLWITDAYMLPPASLLQTILDAARDGVDIRLLVPGSSDLPWIRNLTRIGYRSLLKAGVRIFEWGGPMIHAKSLVTDGHWCRIGSSNLNASSLQKNYEIDLLIEDRELGALVDAQFRRDLSRSREVLRQSRTGPRQLQAVMPSRLAIEAPEAMPPAHRRNSREMRYRAYAVAQNLAGAARRSLYGPLALVLALLGLLFWRLPHLAGTIIALVCVWFAVAAALEALGRRRTAS